MWKLALKINSYKMCENLCFETWMKLVFAIFWNFSWGFKIWKIKFKKRTKLGLSKHFNTQTPRFLKNLENRPTLLYQSLWFQI
jgi:hypothetical protein